MDLILWRHAEAQELGEDGDDLARALTPRGLKQAARMAAWLDRQLPQATRVLVSPARRCEQTAQALARRYRLCPELAPQGTAQALLSLAGWPAAAAPVLVVGHQPTLGRVVAQLLGLPGGECAVRKAGVWWLRHRLRDGRAETVLLSVQAPELL